MRASTIAILGLAVVVAMSAVAWADVVQTGANVVTVTVNGSGMSKDEAVRDAQRKAVEQGAGTYLYSQSQTQDFVLVRDTVLARAAGFLQGWKLLSESTEADGVVQVRISAEVSIQGIEDMWGTVTALMERMGRPKVMVYISERIDRRTQEDSTVQTRIENLLLSNGFSLVNRQQLQEIDRRDLEAAIAEDAPARVQAIAKRFGAQLFITGSTNGTLGESKNVRGVPIHVYGADGDIRCFRSDTAQMLSSHNGRAESADRVDRLAAKKSLEILGNDLGPKVQYDILRFWMDVLEGRGEVQLHVEGLTFAQSVRMRRALEALPQVKAVNATFNNQVAQCSVQSDVNAEQLAEVLVEKLESMLEITDVTQNVIKARFIGQ